MHKTPSWYRTIFRNEQEKPLTRPAKAGESAVAVHPLPSGEGSSFMVLPDIPPTVNKSQIRNLKSQMVKPC